MRALYLNQLERYKQKWYKMHNQKPPNLGFEEETQKKYIPTTNITTDTTVVEGYPAA